MRRALLCLTVLLGACGGSDAQDVTIALSEFDVVADPASADAGEVTFSVTNSGEEVHEFIVVKTELDPAELPTAQDGSFDESESNSRDTLIVLRQGYGREAPDWNKRYESHFERDGIKVKIANASGGSAHKIAALQEMVRAALSQSGKSSAGTHHDH